jgi:hypothetical protein
MRSAVGPENSFFAFYHREDVLTGVRANSPPPFFAFAPLFPHWRLRLTGRHFFPKGEPLNWFGRDVFSEHSIYRSLAISAQQSDTLGPGYEWGIGMLTAEYFLKPEHTVLPSITHVLANGISLPQFLGDVASCRLGTSLASDVELNEMMNRLRLGITHGRDFFAPQFALMVEFSSNSPDVEAAPLDPLSHEGQRRPWQA